MGDFEIVDENTFNRDDGNCRYYNSNTERQCQKANLCFCEFKDPKTDCVISSSKEVCSEEYQVNRLVKNWRKGCENAKFFYAGY